MLDPEAEKKRAPEEGCVKKSISSTLPTAYLGIPASKYAAMLCKDVIRCRVAALSCHTAAGIFFSTEAERGAESRPGEEGKGA